MDEAVRILHELSYIKDTAPKSFDNMRLGEWLDLCLEVYMKNSIKQSTYNGYESYIRNHLKPSLGEVRLQDITPGMLCLGENQKSERNAPGMLGTLFSTEDNIKDKIEIPDKTFFERQLGQ